MSNLGLARDSPSLEVDSSSLVAALSSLPSVLAEFFSNNTQTCVTSVAGKMQDKYTE